MQTQGGDNPTVGDGDESQPDTAGMDQLLWDWKYEGLHAGNRRWVRHWIRVIIVKQWKKPKAIAKGLKWYCQIFGFTFSDEEIFNVANSRKGLYAQCNGDVINYILNPKVLGTKLKRKGKETVYPGLIDPLAYYLSRI